MTEEQINTFLAILRRGSFSGAAQELFNIHKTLLPLTIDFCVIHAYYSIQYIFRTAPNTAKVHIGKTMKKT